MAFGPAGVERNEAILSSRSRPVVFFFFLVSGLRREKREAPGSLCTPATGLLRLLVGVVGLDFSHLSAIFPPFFFCHHEMYIMTGKKNFFLSSLFIYPRKRRKKKCNKMKNWYFFFLKRGRGEWNFCHRKTMSWLSQIKKEKKRKKGGGHVTSRGFAATADWSLRSRLGWLGILSPPPPHTPPNSPLPLHTFPHAHTAVALCSSVQFSRAKMAETKLWLPSRVCMCVYCAHLRLSHSLFHILLNIVVVFGVWQCQEDNTD